MRMPVNVGLEGLPAFKLHVLEMKYDLLGEMSNLQPGNRNKSTLVGEFAVLLPRLRTLTPPSIESLSNPYLKHFFFQITILPFQFLL